MDVYVDAAFGNDGNDGLTPVAPLLTIEAVYEKFPLQLVGEQRRAIHLAGIGGFDSSATGQLIYETPSLWLGAGNEAAVCSWAYRGPHMVPRMPSQGAQSNELVKAHALSATRTCLRFDEPNWTPDAHLGWFMRITRGENLVIFECPAAHNSEDWVDLDVGQMLENGGHLAELLEPGDVCEWVQPGALIRSQPGGANLGSVCLNGKGAGFWNYDDGAHPGGRNGHSFERLAFSGVFAAGVHGLNFDRCHFESHDNNLMGGSGFFVNCSARGLQLQGGFAVAHDQASCRPDSAQSPIHQGIDDPSMELLVNGGGALRIGTGGANSGGIGASYTVEKNLSVYYAPGSKNAITVVGPSVLYVNPPASNRNRIVALQGDGNGGVGIRCTYGGTARVNYLPNNAGRVVGSGGSLQVDGGNVESWSSFDSSPLNGNIQSPNGRITTSGAS